MVLFVISNFTESLMCTQSRGLLVGDKLVVCDNTYLHTFVLMSLCSCPLIGLNPAFPSPTSPPTSQPQSSPLSSSSPSPSAQSISPRPSPPSTSPTSPSPSSSLALSSLPTSGRGTTVNLGISVTVPCSGNQNETLYMLWKHKWMRNCGSTKVLRLRGLQHWRNVIAIWIWVWYYFSKFWIVCLTYCTGFFTSGAEGSLLHRHEQWCWWFKDQALGLFTFNPLMSKLIDLPYER